MRREIYEIIYSLPTDLTFEDIEKIALALNVDAILLYLQYNDYVLKTLRSDLIKDLSEDDNIDLIEEIEDWL